MAIRKIEAKPIKNLFPLLAPCFSTSSTHKIAMMSKDLYTLKGWVTGGDKAHPPCAAAADAGPGAPTGVYQYSSTG